MAESIIRIRVLPVANQFMEDLLPDTGRAPAAEAFVDTFVLVIALRQVVTVLSRTQNPQHAVHKNM
jgi:hypothetical protein